MDRSLRTLFIRSAAQGAVCGIFVWLAYAQVEYFLCVLVPLRIDGFTLPSSHWPETAAVFGAYAIVGGLLGSISTATLCLLKRTVVGYFEAASVATQGFIAAYLALLGFSGTWRGEAGAVFLTGLVLISGLISSLRRDAATRWPRLATSPWLGPVVLLVPFKIVNYWRTPPMAARWLLPLAWSIAVFGAGILLSRIRKTAALPWPAVRFRRAVLVTSCAAALFAATLGLNRNLPAVSQLAAGNTGGRPNILFVIWDTVRADHESVYGYQRDTTPFLREFSRNATLYRNAFAASDMTLSSTASLFTGLYASWHGAHFSRTAPYGRPLDAKFKTIAESLRGLGYRTMAVLANCSYLSPAYQLNQGYELYDVRTPVGSDALDHPYYLRAPLQKLLAAITPAGGELDRRFRRGDAITRDALKLLAVRSAAPFFLTLNYMDAHLPYMPPPPYDRIFPGKDPTLTFDDLQRLRRDVLQFRRRPSSAESAHLRSQYDGAIAFLDAQMKELVAGLKQLGLYDSTMIVLTADHGEALGDRSLLEHAVSVYQDQVHVPLIVKYPGQVDSSVVAAPVSGVDIYPTILETSGAPLSLQLQGRSLLQPDESRVVLSESFRSGLLVSWHPRFDRVERAAIRGPAKFIQSSAGKTELYDLSKDPFESRDLARESNTLASELSRSLAALTATAPPDSAPAHRVDSRSLDRLRSLGYVQ